MSYGLVHCLLKYEKAYAKLENISVSTVDNRVTYMKNANNNVKLSVKYIFIYYKAWCRARPLCALLSNISCPSIQFVVSHKCWLMVMAYSLKAKSFEEETLEVYPREKKLKTIDHTLWMMHCCSTYDKS